jgi:type I restriction enzyme S subunit
MEIKQGFKQTEAGVIPVDWDSLSILDVAKISTGGSDTQDRIDDGKYPFFVRSQKIERINQFTMDCEAILTSGDGVGVGKIFHYINGKFDFHQRVYCLFDFNQKIVGKFLFFQFSKSFYNRVMQLTAKSSVDSVRREMIAEMKLPFPKQISEQNAIADALSNIDELISQTEKLIDKKKAIKLGVMQELLKPKEYWVTKKLGDIFKLSASSSKSNYIVNGGKYIIMDMGAVSSNGTILKTKRTDYNSDILSFGDLVMPKDDIGGGNIIGKVGFIDKDDSYILGDHVYKLQVNTASIDSLYFYYLINSVYVNKYLRSKASGSAQLGLGRKSVLEQELVFPESRIEQTYTAEIIYEMDQAILVLENKSQKLKYQKQGMMQALLTGKIRLL